MQRYVISEWENRYISEITYFSKKWYDPQSDRKIKSKKICKFKKKKLIIHGAVFEMLTHIPVVH